jgi:glycerol uptake facilitator-like aquaporin
VLNKPLYKVIFFEFTGTLFFTYGIALSGLPGYPSDVFVSASLFLAICWAGELTGGHFNPAVTIGIKTSNGL